MNREKEVVIIIVPEVLEKEGFYDILQKRNYEIAVLGKIYTGNKADYFIQADATNLDIVVSELAQFQKRHKISMIYTVSEFGVEVAAAASEILGLKYGSSFASVKRARNKFLTRDFLMRSNIPTPSYFLGNSKEEILNKAENMNFPLIIKPLNAAGSCSVTQINTKEELNSKIDFAFSQRSKMPVNDYRPDTTENYWLVEEYLDGIEISVESCTFEGETTIIAIHDKYCNVCEPYFIEKTFITPSPRFDQEMIKDIEAQTKNILSAIGYDYGISHVEMKITSKGLRLLEINPRMGGGLNMESVLHSTGINILEVLLDIRSGKRPKINIDKRKNVAFTLIPVEEGIVTKIGGFDQAKEINNIEIALPFLKVGDVVKARQANYGGFILGVGKPASELISLLAEAEKCIYFEIESL